MLCMGLGFECGVKNVHGLVNMGADGCRRVNKHVGAETNQNHTHNDPQTANLITSQNTETNNKSINVVEICKKKEKNAGWGVGNHTH